MGGDAAWLHVCALCYCNRLETDGVIVAAILGRLSDRKHPSRLAAKLVEAGIWDLHPAGWQIHDYLHFQQSREDMERKRAEKKSAGVAGNHVRWHVGSEGKPSASCPQCIAEGIAGAIGPAIPTGILWESPRPDPTRPDPTVTSCSDTYPPTECAEGGGELVDKQRLDAVVAAYAQQALAQANVKGQVRSPSSYATKAAATARQHPDLHRLSGLFPTAPPDVIAAALHGEKHSLGSYPRADEMAPVIDLHARLG